MNKKNIELAQLQRFQNLFPKFPNGNVISSEEPDFLIDTSNLTLGIELTELYHQHPSGTTPPQAGEAMRFRVAERAQEIYKNLGMPVAHVSIHFNQNYHIKRNEVEQLAQSISALAVRNLPSEENSNEEAYDWINRSYFPEAVHTITVTRLPQLTDTFFNAPQSTWVSSLASSDIERALNLKEPKYLTYRKQCSEAWLIINTDIGSLSTWFEYDSTLATHSFKSSFDRVFVMSHFSNKYFELNISH